MMSKKNIRVFAPATVANVVCGFDIMGFAVDAPGDLVEMQLEESPGVCLKEITGDHGLLPKDPQKNTVSAAVFDFLKKNNHSNIGVSIRLHKKMPIGSGLGSSAASTIAGLYAINQLLGSPCSPKELLPYALKGEELACGQGHADNVAPSLLGGIVLIRSYNPLDIITIPAPNELVCTIVHPQIEIQTRDARKIIRQQIVLEDAVAQWGNIAGLVSGLYQEDYALIGRSLEDKLIEPHRAILIPEFYAMKEKAMDLGALGFGISGSGPSVFALTRGYENAAKIKKSVQTHLKSVDIASEAYTSKINTAGPKIL